MAKKLLRKTSAPINNVPAPFHTCHTHPKKVGRREGMQWKTVCISFARLLPLLQSPAFCTERSCLWCQSNAFKLAPASTAICNTFSSWQRNGCTALSACEIHPTPRSLWHVNSYRKARMVCNMATWGLHQTELSYMNIKLIDIFFSSLKDPLQEVLAS